MVMVNASSQVTVAGKYHLALTNSTFAVLKSNHCIISTSI
jgi:hypothetical protein